MIVREQAQYSLYRVLIVSPEMSAFFHVISPSFIFGMGENGAASIISGKVCVRLLHHEIQFLHHEIQFLHHEIRFLEDKHVLQVLAVPAVNLFLDLIRGVPATLVVLPICTPSTPLWPPAVPCSV